MADLVEGIDHVALSVADIDRSIRFYCETFGMTLVSRTAFSGKLFDNIMELDEAQGLACTLALGHAQLELFQFFNPAGRPQILDRPVNDLGITHLCFKVHDIHEAYERLSQGGVRFHCPPQDGGWALATYARDPDGNIFELYEIRDGERGAPTSIPRTAV